MTNFDRAFEFLMAVEGGYANDIRDPGGETKFGISKKAYPHLDIANLTLAQAKEIYRKDYWEAISGDSRPYPEALAIFDFAVHSGVSRALAYWKASTGIDDYLALRKDFLASLKAYSTYGKGWTNRLNKLEAEINKTSFQVDHIQLVLGERIWDFYPKEVSVGPSPSGGTTLVARLV